MLFDVQTTIAMGFFEDFIKSISEPDEIIEMENDKRRAALKKEEEEEIYFESHTKDKKELQKQEEEDCFY
jgi:hypothetical protein